MISNAPRFGIGGPTLIPHSQTSPTTQSLSTGPTPQKNTMKFRYKVLSGVVGSFLGGPLGAGLGYATACWVSDNEENEGCEDNEEAIPNSDSVNSRCPHCMVSTVLDGPGYYQCHECSRGFGYLFGPDGFENAGPISPVLFSSFALAGCMAKADGVVCADEIGEVEIWIEHVFELTKEERAACIRAFNHGKRPEFTSPSCCEIINEMAEGDEAMATLEFLAAVAFADGSFTGNERNTLFLIGSQLSISEEEVEEVIQLEVESRQSDGSAEEELGYDPFELLGLSPGASDQEVKSAHRQLSKELHPDLLEAKGVPRSVLDLAITRFTQVQEAYEVIRADKR